MTPPFIGKPVHEVQRMRMQIFCPQGTVHLYYHSLSRRGCEVTISTKRNDEEKPKIHLKDSQRWEEVERLANDLITALCEKFEGVLRYSIDVDTESN